MVILDIAFASQSGRSGEILQAQPQNGHVCPKSQAKSWICWSAASADYYCADALLLSTCVIQEAKNAVSVSTSLPYFIMNQIKLEETAH